MKCKNCQKELASVEIALTKKLINRGATEFLCAECLAKRYKTTPEEILHLAERFKQMGCQLFI